MTEESPTTTQPARRLVPANLHETQPDAAGLFHWILASPMLLFLAWLWVDLFAHYSPIPFYWLDATLGIGIYVAVIVLPIGLATFWVVTSCPQLFGHAGWDVQPLENHADDGAPVIRYSFRQRYRAKTTWPRLWTRAGQGWVYLEIVAILVGGVLMVPIFFSATEFGFGQR
jgi:hypothetical protein